MSEMAIRYCQHFALMRLIAKNEGEWKGLLLGLWKTGNDVQYLSIQELFSDGALLDDYWLVGLRRTHGARWLRNAGVDDPIGYMAELRAEQKRHREHKAKPKRAWEKALERWKATP